MKPTTDDIRTTEDQGEMEADMKGARQDERVKMKIEMMNAAETRELK